jgi:acyl-CoA synthetase (AMP-forming)/AMP-acid ligase II
VGILSKNRPEFLEAMFGAFKARCAPYTINYRYGPSEVWQLVGESKSLALFYESEFASVVSAIAPKLPRDFLLIQIGDTEPLVPGALLYEEAIESSHESRPGFQTSPDDLYVLHTGGTTGHPKAVLWRQADIFVAGIGGPELADKSLDTSRDLVLKRISDETRWALPAPPFMHGAGQWVAIGNLLSGNAIAIQNVTDHLDADDIWTTVKRNQVSLLMVAGNAYGVPLLEQLRKNSYDLSCLKFIVTGAVAMGTEVKRGLLDFLPGVQIIETVGATESGSSLSTVATTGLIGSAGFEPSPGTTVLQGDRSGLVQSGSSEVGWLAKSGHIPLGYLGDPEGTEATFPTIAGIRYSIPGDRARVLDSRYIELLGRDAVTINSGGEKIFAEEVQGVLEENPQVYDAIVFGREHSRWGQEVVAVVQLCTGSAISEEGLRGAVGERLARYKVPRRIFFVEKVQRNPMGKPDYRWANEVANQAIEQEMECNRSTN